MGDKNGKGDTVLRQNGPGADKEWTRIIVRLNVPDIDRMQSKSAALKDPAAARAMDQQIAKQIALVADRVISKVEPAGAKLIRRYDTLPLLAMAVTPKAVSVLKSLPEVIGIEADSLNRPMR